MDDIGRIELQEQRLQFAAFDFSTAWELGLLLKQSAEARRAPVVIDIQLWTMPLLCYALPGATPSNFDWVRRKRNAVAHFHRSTYWLGCTFARDGKTLRDHGELPERDYAVHGGSFPIRISGTGCVGAVTVSGLPQREDHSIVVSAIAGVLKIDLGEIALD